MATSLLRLPRNVPYPRSITAIARPYLQQLIRTTGETLTLCIPDGDEAFYIDQINSLRALQVRDWRGQRLPMHAASDGKLYLADARDDRSSNIWISNLCASFTRNTIVKSTGLCAKK